MPHEIRVEGAEKLFALSKELKAIGNKKLQAALRKRLREAAAPVVDEVKKAAAHTSPLGAAGDIPRTIQLKMSYVGRAPGAYIIANRNKMPKGHEALPGLMEYGSRRNRSTIRHPVFGNENNWVSQPTHPFLGKTVSKNAEKVRLILVKVLDDVAKDIHA